MAYDPLAARIAQATIITAHEGETLEKRFQAEREDIVIADRGYAQPEGLRSVVEAGADVIVRVTCNSLKRDRSDSALPSIGSPSRSAAQDQGALEIPVLAHKARGR